MQGTSQSDWTGDGAPRALGGRRVCILGSRQCVETVRQTGQSNGMNGGSGGGAWRDSWVLRGPRARDRLVFSARRGYGPVRRAMGAFRPQVPCCLGFAGHHRGVLAVQ
jgi:hypothetical protein